MTYLVTGSEGFIGSHLVEHLVRSGISVRATVLYNSFGHTGWLADLPPEIATEIDIVFGDVRDRNWVNSAVKGCDTIIHAAALISVPYSYSAAESFLDTNAGGTLNILSAARDEDVRRLVQISSSEVYGTAQYVPIDENHPLGAQSPYAATKIAADQMAKSFHHTYDLPVTLVRPFNTYGPRQSTRAIIPSIITQCLRESANLNLGVLHPTRDFTYAPDLAVGLAAAATAPGIDGEVINFGTGFEISIRDIVEMIAEILEVDVEVKRDEVRVRPANSEVERLFADIKKAEKMLGWQPKFAGKSGFQAGLKETCNWFRNISSDQKSMYPEAFNAIPLNGNYK